MKNSKRILSTVIGAVFALSATQAFAATTLKLSHNQNRDHAVHKAMTQFADDVKTKTNGDVRIRIYPDAQLGNQRESMELMQNGALDIVKSKLSHRLTPSLTCLTCSVTNHTTKKLSTVISDRRSSTPAKTAGLSV